MARTMGHSLTLSTHPGAAPYGLIAAGLLAAGASAVRLLSLDDLGFSICTFKLWTGLPCPSCGSTRALGCLAHFDLAGALSMNPLATLAAAGIVCWAAADLVLLLSRRRLSLRIEPALHPMVLRLLIAAVIVNWAYLIAAGR